MCTHVHTWRHDGYRCASETSKSLLNFWFEQEHLVEAAQGLLDKFRYYYALRKAVEAVVWLNEVRGARGFHDLLRFEGQRVF